MRGLVCTVLAALVSLSLANDDQLTIHTIQGAIRGSLVSPRVRQFLGVPYGVANRWEAPQLPLHRDTLLPTTSFGDSCVQQLTRTNAEFLALIGLEGQVVTESESCLNVHIWAPTLDRPQGTAVLIWFHGGGFEFGTANTVFYDGHPFVENNDDLIVVTVEYRKGIFGFPNAPQLDSTTVSQNFGALDVDLAIHWVHENIGRFGGNAERITLFGQSAGSAFVSAYTFANPHDSIVKGVIEQSGSLAGLTPLIPTAGRPLNTFGWEVAAELLGCGPDATPAQFACMKSIPFRTLSDLVSEAGVDFLPTQDEITFFSNTTARSAVGNFLQVPMLIGNTANEGNIFGVQFDVVNPGVLNSTLLALGSQLLTEVAFVCPSGTTSSDYFTHGVPVWRYRYEGIFPDIALSPDLGAFHASEIPIVFGTFNQSSFGPPADAIETALSQYVQGAWVAFARDPHAGLLRYGWPRYNPQQETLARLGNPANLTGTIFSQGNLFDVECQPDLQLVELILRELGVIF